MAQQLVLLEVERRAPRRSRRAPARAPEVASEWQLDERTVAIGRRGLEDARRALQAGSTRAA